MNKLLKWQLVSFVSRGIAMIFGIVQSVIIARILTVSEFGLVGIVVGIGSIFGVYQHLGLASGSTREISAAKDKKEIYKIFITSVLIRYTVTFPLAAGLFFMARYLAVEKYSDFALITPLKLYALVLLAQGLQSLFNSLISGTQRFKHLFVYQAAIALVSVIVYVPLTLIYKINGYFVSLLIFSLVGSAILGVLALFPLRGSFALPNRSDLKRLLKEILSISLGIYLVKILFMIWQKFGPVLLGLSVTAEQVGIFSFALLYAGKLMGISDAVTDVSLPILSKEYSVDFENFKNLFSSNFDKILAFTILVSFSAIYWSREVFHFALNGQKYDASLVYVPPLIFAFVFYSLVNIIKSGIIIPTKMVKEMVISYVALLLTTVIFYFSFSKSVGSITSMVYGMVTGSFFAFVIMVLLTSRKLKYNFFNLNHLAIVLIGVLFSFSDYWGSLQIKSIIYVFYLLVYTAFLFFARFVTKSHIMRLVSLASSIFKYEKE